MTESKTRLFVAPSCVDAVIVLAPEADPRAVLTEVAREFVLRFGLRPDFWQLDVDNRRDGFPAPEARDRARLSASLVEGFVVEYNQMPCTT